MRKLLAILNAMLRDGTDWRAESRLIPELFLGSADQGPFLRSLIAPFGSRSKARAVLFMFPRYPTRAIGLLEMHQFPPATELQFLVGDEISQIRLDPYNIQFLFSSGASMTVEWRIEHIDAGGVLHAHDCTASTGEAIYLHQLLQQPVSAVDAEPLCLTLTFRTGAVLRVLTETGTYECGQIFPSKDSGRGFIVF